MEVQLEEPVSSLKLWGTDEGSRLGARGTQVTTSFEKLPPLPNASLGKLYYLQVTGLVCDSLICNLGYGLLNLNFSFCKRRTSWNSLSLMSLVPPSRKEWFSFEEIVKQLKCANRTGKKLKLANLSTLVRHFRMPYRRQCYGLNLACPSKDYMPICRESFRWWVLAGSFCSVGTTLK